MKTVFLVIPNFIFSSDLLRTHYLKYLSEKYRVVVLMPFSGDYYHASNVFYEKWELENPKLWDWFKLFRISLVNEFDYLNSIKHFYKRPNYRDSFKRRLLRFFGKPFSRILTAEFFSRLESKLLKKSEKFSELAVRYHPELLVTATPGFSPFEAELIHLAKRAKIPTAAVNFTWDNLTTNSKHIRKTDYLIAWNAVMKQEAIDIHRYAPGKVFVSGTPRFDPYFTKESKAAPKEASLAQPWAGREPTRDEFLASKGLNPQYKTIFHTTVTKAYPFQKKYIRDLIDLREKGKIPYVNLFVRTHPLDVFDNYKEFLGVKDLCIEKSGEGIEMSYNDLLNLKYSLKYTDLNINYASTISIEASIFDKPIINIGYLGIYALAYEFNHYRPICESGAVKLAKTDEDLPRFINMYLENPSLDREARRKIVEDYVIFTDGLSYKRSVDLLSNFFK